MYVYEGMRLRSLIWILCKVQVWKFLFLIILKITRNMLYDFLYGSSCVFLVIFKNWYVCLVSDQSVRRELKISARKHVVGIHDRQKLKRKVSLLSLSLILTIYIIWVKIIQLYYTELLNISLFMDFILIIILPVVHSDL